MYVHVRLASPLPADIGCFDLLLPHVHAQGVSNQFCPVFQQINVQISRLHSDM